MHVTTLPTTILAILLTTATSISASPIPTPLANPSDAWVTGERFNATIPQDTPKFIDFLHRHLPLSAKLMLLAEHNVPSNHHDYPSRATARSATNTEITSFENLFVNETLLHEQSLRLCSWLPAAQAFNRLPLSSPNATALAAAMVRAQRTCMLTLGGKIAGGAKIMRNSSAVTTAASESKEDKTPMQILLYEVLEIATRLMITPSASTASAASAASTASAAAAAAAAAKQNSSTTAAVASAHDFEDVVVRGPANRVLCAVFESWCREEVYSLGGLVVTMGDFVAGGEGR